MTNKYYCPVCWRPVEPTPNHKIFGHFDTNKHPCEASYEPFHIVLTETPPLHDHDYGTPNGQEHRKPPKWWPKSRQKRALNGQFAADNRHFQENLAI